MHKKLLEAFNLLDPVRQERLKDELKSWSFLTEGQQLTEEIFLNILTEVSKMWNGEKDNTVDFNIIQGPLGADRVDYLLRDSYFAGTPFGKIDYQRIIHFCSIGIDDNGIERLCYAIKTFESIIAFLLSKFLMYSTVYYHKTTRAADRMVKELLKETKIPLGLVERTKDFEKFEEIDEYTFFKEVSTIYPAMGILDDLFNRRLFRVVYEYPYRHDYSKSSVSSEELKKNVLDRAESFVEDIRKEYKDKTGEELKSPLYVDTPYELRVISPEELTSSKVFLYDPTEPKRVISFDEAAEEKGYNPFILSTIRPIRIYARESHRLELQMLAIAKRRDGK
jgi:hypothetical protein